MEWSLAEQARGATTTTTTTTIAPIAARLHARCLACRVLTRVRVPRPRLAAVPRVARAARPGSQGALWLRLPHHERRRPCIPHLALHRAGECLRADVRARLLGCVVTSSVTTLCAPARIRYDTVRVRIRPLRHCARPCTSVTTLCASASVRPRSVQRPMCHCCSLCDNDSK